MGGSKVEGSLCGNLWIHSCDDACLSGSNGYL